jgi:hypothetical protein
MTDAAGAPHILHLIESVIGHGSFGGLFVDRHTGCIEASEPENIDTEPMTGIAFVLGFNYLVQIWKREFPRRVHGFDAGEERLSVISNDLDLHGHSFGGSGSGIQCVGSQ